MTESFRRSGEYETPQGEQPQAYPQQQHISSPVNPEWPAPQAAFGADGGAYGGGHDGGLNTAAGGDGNGDGTALLPTVPAEPAPKKKRTRGPIALLAAVAIVAAAVGGGTAYAFQELAGKDTVA